MLRIAMMIYVVSGLTINGHAQLSFTEIAQEAGMPAGDEAIALFDYNNDGKLDILVASWREGFGALIALNGEDSFVDLTKVIGLDVAVGNGAAIGDLDNDGDVDVYITGATDGPNTLLENLGDGAFRDRTEEADVGIPGENLWRSSASVIDYDNDGDLDIFAGLAVGANTVDRLFRNDGNWKFTDVSRESGLAVERGTPHHVFADFDNDGLQDLYIPKRKGLGGDQLPESLFRNNGDGTFTQTIFSSGLSHSASIEGCAAFDYNNDGLLDLFLTSFDDTHHLLYQNKGAMKFSNVTSSANINVVSAVGVGAHAGDFDNDGWMDLYVANISITENFFFHNNGDGTFTEISAEAGISGKLGTIIVNSGDYNSDGFLDIFETNWGNDKLYQNQGNSNHWLHIDLVGTESNRSAIGARIKVTAGDLTMVREVNSGNGYGGETHITEFGLRGAPVADEVEVKWPAGSHAGFR